MRREMQDPYRGSGPDVVIVLHCSAVAYQARVALIPSCLAYTCTMSSRGCHGVAQNCCSAVRGSLYNRGLQSFAVACQLQAPVLWHALDKHLSL